MLAPTYHGSGVAWRANPTKPLQVSLLLFRAVIAFIFLWHGMPKALNVAAAMDKFTGFGLPPILGPMTGWVEVISASLLLLGLFHRMAVLLLLTIIVGALLTVQIPGGVSAGLERDLLILTGLTLLVFVGPGRLALMPTDRSGSS